MATEYYSEPGSKFGLNYVLRVQAYSGNIVEITYPLTCEFNVTRNNLASVNSASFTVYNLNEKTRLSLFRDSFDTTSFRTVEFYAGYANEGTRVMPLVFSGTIRQCYSERVGQDYKTVVDCYDGQQALGSGFISETTEKGLSIKQLVEKSVAALSNIKSAVVGAISGDSKRGLAAFGNPADIVKSLTGNNLYIDNMNAYVLDTTEVLSGQDIILTSDSGIINIPKKTETSVSLSMLFEPRIKPSQLIEIRFSLNKIYNGVYKLTGFSHIGTISGAVSSQVITDLVLLSMTPGFFKVIPDDNQSSGMRIVRS